MRVVRTLLILVATAFVVGPAWAETYRVDLLVFLQGGADGEQPGNFQSSRSGRVFQPDDTAGLAAVGIHVLPGSGLGELESRLVRSGHYQPLLRISWTQSDPPERGGPALHLAAGSPGHQLEGTVALEAGHYLHLNADLSWLQGDAEGGNTAWRLHEVRRMKRDEIHYIDSAKLGILARVTKVE
jgi:hypothetical protein